MFAVRVGTRMTASLSAEETGLPTGAITGVVATWERLATSVVKVIKMTNGYSTHRCLVWQSYGKAKPNFWSHKTSEVGISSNYSDEELAIILDFLTNCNKMTQEITTNENTNKQPMEY